jgi:hypothetical protein
LRRRANCHSSARVRAAFPYQRGRLITNSYGPRALDVNDPYVAERLLAASYGEWHCPHCGGQVVGVPRPPGKPLAKREEKFIIAASVFVLS